jgi:hypothetical protein
LGNIIRQPASEMFSERVHRPKCHILDIRIVGAMTMNLENCRSLGNEL